MEKENGFTLGYDKYNWDETQSHFITEDCTEPIDFGEGKKNIYALPVRQSSVSGIKRFSWRQTILRRGARYIFPVCRTALPTAGFCIAPYSGAHTPEDELHRWFSTNPNVEVHAYVKNGKYCVVNNTYTPQSTVVYRGDGTSFELQMASNEIKWYKM